MDAPIAAPAAPTTSTATPTLTPAQSSLSADQNIAAGQPGSPWSTPNLNSISSSNTQPTTPIVVPPPVVAPDTSAGIVGGANQTLAQAQAAFTPAPTALDNQQSGLLSDIANLTGQDANEGDETASLNDQYGVTSDQTALTAATNELATKTASYNAMQANLGGNNSVETSAVLAAQNAGLTKARAADIGITQAKITAAQGNLSLAQQQVTNAINLKYGDIEAQIKTKQAQLDAIAPNLSAEQKTQAAAQQEILTQQKTQVATDKATATQNLKLVVANNITQPFANEGGTIFDASTGQEFSDPQDFFAAAGVTSFAQAYAQGLIGDIKDTGITLKTSNVNGQTVQFGYDKNGNVVSQTVLGTTTGAAKNGGGSGGGNSTVVTYQAGPNGTINQVTTVNGKVTKTVQQKPTAGTTAPASTVQRAITNLKAVSGSDGAVAPSTWNEALTQWLNAGYSLASFKSNFGSFAKNASSPLSDYNGM